MLLKALALIFRVPELGQVKSRLASEIGVERAFFYYNKMLYETLEKLMGYKEADIIGFYKGSKEKVNFNIDLVQQKGENLGEIILESISELLDRGYQKVIVVGSDSPDLPTNFISEAFDMLGSSDIVIGPSEDGGFYLLGCKTKIDSAIFYDIKWGSSSVLKSLKENLQLANIKYSELPIWYDVDDLNSLNRWLRK